MEREPLERYVFHTWRTRRKKKEPERERKSSTGIEKLRIRETRSSGRKEGRKSLKKERNLSEGNEKFRIVNRIKEARFYRQE